MQHSLDRLTAPKPNWDLAIVYCQGIPEGIPIGSTHASIRKDPNASVIIVKILGVPHPDNRKRCTCDVEMHIDNDQVTRIEFFENLKPLAAIKAPTANEISSLVRP